MKESIGKFKLHQKSLSSRLLQKFEMLDCYLTKAPMLSGTDLSHDDTDVLLNPKPFQQPAGFLLYISNTTRMCFVIRKELLQREALSRKELSASYSSTAIPIGSGQR